MNKIESRKEHIKEPKKQIKAGDYKEAERKENIKSRENRKENRKRYTRSEDETE